MDNPPDGPALGAFQICLQVADLQVSQDFYSALGFRVKEGSVVSSRTLPSTISIR